jgi:hypothetical protein
VLDAFENQEFPYGQMISLVNNEREEKRNQIVDVHFSFANYLDKTEEETAGQTFTPFEIEDYDITTQYEFKVEMRVGNGQLWIAFIYDNKVYDDDTIELLKEYYYNILIAIIKNPCLKPGDIQLENTVSYIRD